MSSSASSTRRRRPAAPRCYGSLGHHVHALGQVLVQVALVQQQVVLLVGAVHAVGALEAGLLAALVLDVPLQRALVLVLVAAVGALVQRPALAVPRAPQPPAVTQYIRTVQCN